MKLLRARYVSGDLIYQISDFVSGDNTLSYILGLVLACGSIFLSFMLIGRVNTYNEVPFEEHFSEAKAMKSFTQWANSFTALWILLNLYNMVNGNNFGNIRIVFLLMGIIGYVFSWYGLKKFSEANKKHSIDVAKKNKGDPSIVMSEDYGLSQAQKDAVSMIVGNAGVSGALSPPKSDEEVFGVIDDPVYDDPHTPRLVCRSCGRVNNPKHNICAYCGKTLDKTKKALPSEQQSEIDKILNGAKGVNKDEDPVQRILRSAGVIQTENGKYISAKKAAETGIEKIEIMPTTDKKPDKDIAVTPLPESNIISPSPIDSSVSVTELKGTDFYKNSDGEDTLTEKISNESYFTTDNSLKGNSAESVFYGGAEEQIRCRFCGEMNDKNSGQCIFCGTLL